MIHSNGRPSRSGSSPELQKLVLCLGVVAAVVFATFGIAKLMVLLPSRRWTAPVGVRQSIDLVVDMVAELESQFPTAGRKMLVDAVTPAFSATDPIRNTRNIRASAVSFRKARPLDFRIGAIQYTKTSPSLQHINAPSTYAMRHRRRVDRTRPGPSPLRNVIHANSAPHRRTTTKCAAPGNKITPACAPEPAPCWESVEHLHRTADAVVGAHPDALPLIDRVPPPVHQTSFGWVSSSGVPATFKFGLVRGLNARGRGSAVRGHGHVKHASIHGHWDAVPKPSPALVKSSRVNVEAKKEFAAGAKKDFGYRARNGDRKENAAMIAV